MILLKQGMEGAVMVAQKNPARTLVQLQVVMVCGDIKRGYLISLTFFSL